MVELAQKIAWTASILLVVPFAFILLVVFSMKEEGKTLKDEDYASVNAVGNGIFVLLAFSVAVGLALEIWK